MEKSTDQIFNEKLKGTIAIELKPDKTLEEFCEKNFNNYNHDQYEAVAIRLYFGKEVVVTLYALDKVRQEGTTYHKDKLPVKKFKMNAVYSADVLSFIDEFNFTITTGNYPIEDMEVINK
jgi:hypothetical protein